MSSSLTLDRAKLALDTILGRPTAGIPSWMLHIMDHDALERLSGRQPGSYRQDPEGTYLDCQRAIGTCLLDQYIPRNPLTMGPRGYEAADRGATTGAEQIICDGMVIDSPEAVVTHLERCVFPRLREEAAAFDMPGRCAEILASERALQEKLGPGILKSGYGFVRFPTLAYTTYGYANYFMAYSLYPEVMEEHFRLQADLALLNNRAAARAYAQGDLPPLYRLDHDMADSRGTLVSIASLERLWFPHFCRALEPLLHTEVSLIWHCDGNPMEMVPRLLEVGIAGFQGFQYEDGMDYPRISKLRTRTGEALCIVAGVSVTRTLPMGRPGDVKRELAWLVEHGAGTRLFLGASSSIAPGVPWDNLATLVEGLHHYQTRGPR